jgi:hypothetical protein
VRALKVIVNTSPEIIAAELTQSVAALVRLPVARCYFLPGKPK